MSEQRYCMMNDEDGHTYIIKVEEKDLFEELLYADEGYDAFNEKFQYEMLSYHPNVYTFTDPRNKLGEAWEDGEV